MHIDSHVHVHVHVHMHVHVDSHVHLPVPMPVHAHVRRGHHLHDVTYTRHLVTYTPRNIYTS